MEKKWKKVRNGIDTFARSVYNLSAVPALPRCTYFLRPSRTGLTNLKRQAQCEISARLCLTSIEIGFPQNLHFFSIRFIICIPNLEYFPNLRILALDAFPSLTILKRTLAPRRIPARRFLFFCILYRKRF